MGQAEKEAAFCFLRKRARRISRQDLGGSGSSSSNGRRHEERDSVGAAIDLYWCVGSGGRKQSARTFVCVRKRCARNKTGAVSSTN